MNSSPPASATASAFFRAGFSAELAFRECRLNAAAFAPIGRAAHFGHPLAVGLMPVLIFTIYRRDGMRQADWIGLN